jgi:hypothetical protein
MEYMLIFGILKHVKRKYKIFSLHTHIYAIINLFQPFKILNEIDANFTYM